MNIYRKKSIYTNTNNDKELKKRKNFLGMVNNIIYSF